jgi:Zn-dependent alcohol dehydrogenase
LEVIRFGSPALIQGVKPFKKNFTPGHEYMGTVAGLGPGADGYRIGESVTVEIHVGCGQCKRCRLGMYTSYLNYVNQNKGHSATNNKLRNAKTCMKQSDFPNNPVGDEVVARSLRPKQGKGRRRWVDIALWIVIIVSWCGFGLLAFTIR